jgi:hypothetical protein
MDWCICFSICICICKFIPGANTLPCAKGALRNSNSFCAWQRAVELRERQQSVRESSTYRKRRKIQLCSSRAGALLLLRRSRLELGVSLVPGGG